MWTKKGLNDSIGFLLDEAKDLKQREVIGQLVRNIEGLEKENEDLRIDLEKLEKKEWQKYHSIIKKK
jgi:regulator of replication initiation timing